MVKLKESKAPPVKSTSTHRIAGTVTRSIFEYASKVSIKCLATFSFKSTLSSSFESTESKAVLAALAKLSVTAPVDATQPLNA